MLIAWTNRIDAGTLTTDSALATLPVTNLQQQHLSRRWHTAAGVKSAYVILDAGASVPCACLGIFGTNLTPSATVRIRSNEAGGLVTTSLEMDTGVVGAGVVAGYGNVYKTFASMTSRYWRIDVADASVPDNLQVGRMFLGPYWTPTAQSWGWGPGWQDLSRKSRTLGGQILSQNLPKFRTLNFALDWNTEAEMFANAFEMERAVGLTGDVLVIPNPSGNYVSQQSVFGPLISLTPTVNEMLNVWRTRYSVEERL